MALAGASLVTRRALCNKTAKCSSIWSFSRSFHAMKRPQRSFLTAAALKRIPGGPDYRSSTTMALVGSSLVTRRALCNNITKFSSIWSFSRSFHAIIRPKRPLLTAAAARKLVVSAAARKLVVAVAERTPAAAAAGRKLVAAAAARKLDAAVAARTTDAAAAGRKLDDAVVALDIHV